MVTPKTKWSLRNAMLWGVAASVLTTGLDFWHGTDPWLHAQGAEFVSYWAARSLFAPLLFVLIAIIRNLTVRSE
jgi:hypothetical protein